MNLLIKKATLIVEDLFPPQVTDVLVMDGKISEIGNDLQALNALLIDGEGKFLVPGLVDVHVHFRDPGQTEKEDLRSGSYAALAGGFTTVIAEPNTRPPIDTPFRLRRLLEDARKKSPINFFSKAAITRGMMGERLTDIAKLKEAGARALSDDGNPVPTSRLMRKILIKGRDNGILITPHCEESPFYRKRILEKERKEKGEKPYTLEARFIERDIELAEKTGGPLHLSHVSLAKSVELIAKAKRRGVKVTAEATPHHLLLTEKVAKEIGPNAKVNPPLRSEEDVSAIREGLASGVIDIIASDHAPHTPEEKNQDWEEAPFGVIGLETTLGLVLTYLVRPGILTLSQAIEKLTIVPARIFGLDTLGVGQLKVGIKADMTLIDFEKRWRVDVNRFYSKGRNCPFDGWDLQGKAVLTIVGGRIWAKDGVVVSENQRGEDCPVLGSKERGGNGKPEG